MQSEVVAQTPTHVAGMANDSLKTPLRRRGHNPSKNANETPTTTPSPYRTSPTDDRSTSARRSLNEVFSPAHEKQRNGMNEAIKECPLNTIANQLQSDFRDTVDEAAEALQLLAISASEEDALDIATSGVIKSLVERVRSGAHPEEEMAALQNLCAGKDPDGSIKIQMVEHGIIPAVVRFLDAPRPELQLVAVANVLNLAIDAEERKVMFMDAGAIEKITPLCLSNDKDMVATALAALTSLSIGAEERKARIEASGIMSIIVDLLRENEFDVRLEALGLLQSLVYCNDRRKQRLLDLNFIEVLTLMLADESTSQDVAKIAERFLKGLAGFSAYIKRYEKADGSMFQSLVDVVSYWAA